MTSRYLLLFSTILLISIACNNNGNSSSTDKDIALIPDELSGSWILEMPAVQEGVPDQLFRRIFNKDEDKGGIYEIYWIATFPDKGPIMMAGEKGEFTVSVDTIFMTPTAFGSEQRGPMSEEYYDTTKWYYPGDTMFDLFRNDPFGRFHIHADTLYWKMDLNNDGSFLDQNEVTKFYKEK